MTVAEDTSSANNFYNSMGYSVHEAILIYYTYKCNIQCGHCSYSCGPHRTEKMNMEDAKRIIRGAAFSGIHVIELMGGELFLYYDELLELITYASALGMKTSLDTNGYWGRDDGIADDRLENLLRSGLSRLFVSIDIFHQKFIPLEYPLNIIRTCREKGITTWCNFCISSDSEKDKHLLSKVKEETDNIFIMNPVPYGRMSRLKKNLKVDDCYLQCISILVNGDTFVCAGHSDRENSNILDTPLYMGNCIENNPEDVLKQKNILCVREFFNKDSPVWFKNFLQQEPYITNLNNNKYNHICELCRDLLHNKEISIKVMKACT
jgi:MoaA/NifB/PqqE/SkfB family radical SAM enzyme